MLISLTRSSLEQKLKREKLFFSFEGSEPSVELDPWWTDSTGLISALVLESFLRERGDLQCSQSVSTSVELTFAKLSSGQAVVSDSFRNYPSRYMLPICISIIYTVRSESSNYICLLD